MSRYRSIGGISVKIDVTDPSLREPTDALFAHLSTTDTPPMITVEHRWDAPQVPSTEADVSTDEIRCWYAADGVAVQHVSGASGRRHGDVVTVGGISAAPDRDRAFRQTCQLPLLDALRLCHRHTIHAAAVERNGRAVVVVGESGFGKSTFAFAAACSGWSIVADDLLVIDTARDERPPHVAGFHKALHIPREVLGGVAPPDWQPLRNDARERWTMPASNVMSRGEYAVGAIVLLEHSRHGSTFRVHDDSAETVRALLRSHPLITVPGAAASFLPTAARLATRPAFVYAHANHARDRVAGVGEFVHFLTTQVLTTPQ